jgi:AcrR family transcriptional regulator
MSSSPAPRRAGPVRDRRRTQQERRSESRARLLEAAIECLVEQGWAHTTTSDVARRAGLSQGALFKHFPTKAELVAGAAGQLFAALVAEYRAAFAEIAETLDRSAAAIDLLWRIFRQPRLQAAFELYVVARTDAELARSLAPVAEQHRENLRRHARELFPEAASRPEFPVVVDLVLDAMQGAALGHASLPANPGHVRVLAFLTDLARRTFEPSGPAFDSHA